MTSESSPERAKLIQFGSKCVQWRSLLKQSTVRTKGGARNWQSICKQVFVTQCCSTSRIQPIWMIKYWGDICHAWMISTAPSFKFERKNLNIGLYSTDIDHSSVFLQGNDRCGWWLRNIEGTLPCMNGFYCFLEGNWKTFNIGLYSATIGHSVFYLTLSGLEGNICPSLVKGLEGHICPSVVTSWWHHCDVI